MIRFEAATGVLITDIQGRLVQQQKLYDTISQIETNSLPNGMYYVQVQQGERQKVMKLVIIR